MSDEHHHQPQTIPPGKPGQILMMGDDYRWHWIYPDRVIAAERRARRFTMLVSCIVVGLLLTSLILCFSAKVWMVPQ